MSREAIILAGTRRNAEVAAAQAARNAAMVEWSLAGLTDAEIAGRVGLTRDSVRAILKKAGVPPKKPGPPPLLSCQKARKRYNKLRDAIGWQKAREAMGI